MIKLWFESETKTVSHNSASGIWTRTVFFFLYIVVNTFDDLDPLRKCLATFFPLQKNDPGAAP